MQKKIRLFLVTIFFLLIQQTVLCSHFSQGFLVGRALNFVGWNNDLPSITNPFSVAGHLHRNFPTKVKPEDITIPFFGAAFVAGFMLHRGANSSLLTTSIYASTAGYCA